jgi:flagellar biosynthesis GTPase FlhF
MNFINQLRALQADDSSSDEEFPSFVTSATPPDSEDGSSASSIFTVNTTPDKPARKRKHEADDAPQSAKKPKKELSTPPRNGESPAATEPAQTQLSDKSKKRHFDDTAQAADGGHQSPAKKRKSASPKARDAEVPMEYHERVVYDMLNDPIGFDDLVRDTKRKTPNHVKSSFAKWRRRQRQPTPPLVMSGAISVKLSAPKPQSALVVPPMATGWVPGTWAGGWANVPDTAVSATVPAIKSACA